MDRTWLEGVWGRMHGNRDIGGEPGSLLLCMVFQSSFRRRVNYFFSFLLSMKLPREVFLLHRGETMMQLKLQLVY